ncbi:hypothetical protein Rhe02_54610 [Rhizocola hellebori]|uniref:PD(D/E)XK endonuclease domain-containing protein n=1 Tax=Rhizocola hellebori TaxID=1392758 RepID=A0A8J3QAV3_9ACTN|nr:hypothetical protein Rhe02_54610 [Rhizocola hellebori]
MPKARGEFATLATVGAASELRVCAELMRRGYQVFRCESSSAPFDLVAHKAGSLWRVEVKTITEPVGTYGPGFPTPTNGSWDILALVGESKYFFFDSDVPMSEIRTIVRAAYGFGPSRKPSQLAGCGDLAAYTRHLKRGELPCEPCASAHRTNFLAKKAKATGRPSIKPGPAKPAPALALGWVGTDGCTIYDDGMHRSSARRACGCGWRP